MNRPAFGPARAHGSYRFAANDPLTLSDRLQQIGVTVVRGLEQHQTSRCLQPVKPHHVLAKEYARNALCRVRVARRIPGICNTVGYWTELNYAETWLREAIRAHRFNKVNSATQTFGSALRSAA